MSLFFTISSEARNSKNRAFFSKKSFFTIFLFFVFQWFMNLQFLGFCDFLSLLFPCYFLVISLLFPCYFLVISLSFPCYFLVISLSFPCFPPLLRFSCKNFDNRFFKKISNQRSEVFGFSFLLVAHTPFALFLSDLFQK